MAKRPERMFEGEPREPFLPLFDLGLTILAAICGLIALALLGGA